MTHFQSGQTASQANAAIKSSLKTRDAAQQCAVLWFEEILVRKLYLTLGYSSINQYAKVELGFSKSHIGEFLQLCRTFKKLPKVKQKIASGELPYTSARVLARVANEETQDGWLDFAVNHSRRALEKEVKVAKLQAADVATGQTSLLPAPPSRRPAAVVPVRVNFEMSPTQFARYEALWEQLCKQSHAPADKVDALLDMMASYLTENPDQNRSARADLPATQIHIHQCPDCAKATVQTGKGELEIAEAELDQARCDCLTSRPNERNKAAVRPALRREVLARARHKCQRKGCDHSRYLEVHHIVPRHRGGSNDPANLQVLCAACHRLVHATGFMVKEPAAAYGSNTSSALSNTTSRPASKSSIVGVTGTSGIKPRPLVKPSTAVANVIRGTLTRTWVWSSTWPLDASLQA